MFFGGIFDSLDHGWASLMHGMQNGFFNTFFKYFSYLADKGVIILIAAIVLMLFKKTRMRGAVIFLAVAAAIILGYAAKFVIARPRPFFDQASDYYLWWQAAGADSSSSYSCPSGHASIAFAFATAFIMTFDKRYGWTGIVFALIICVARTYLMKHYLSDVLFGMVFGLVSGVCAYFITQLIFDALNKHGDNKFCNFILEADIMNAFKKNEE